MHDRNKKSTDYLVSSLVLPSFPGTIEPMGQKFWLKMPIALLKWPIMGKDDQCLDQNWRFSVRSIIDCSQGSIDLADKGCQRSMYLSSKLADVYLDKYLAVIPLL